MPPPPLLRLLRTAAQRTRSLWPGLRREPSRRPQAVLCSVPDSSDSAYAPPLCMGGATLNAEMTLEPENPLKNWIEGVRPTLFAASFLHNVCSTHSSPKGTIVKAWGCRRLESAVRLCLALKVHHCPPHNLSRWQWP